MAQDFSWETSAKKLFRCMESRAQVTDGRIAVFDRDGTLIEDVGYLRTPDEVRLIPGAAEAVRLLNERRIFRA
jgi:hypothetical protein